MFGLLLVAVLRLFSRSAAEAVENALNLPPMGKPTEGEAPPIAEPFSQPSQDEADKSRALRDIAEYTDILIVPANPGTPNGDLLSDSDLSSRGAPKT